MGRSIVMLGVAVLFGAAPAEAGCPRDGVTMSSPGDVRVEIDRCIDVEAGAVRPACRCALLEVAAMIRATDPPERARIQGHVSGRHSVEADLARADAAARAIEQLFVRPLEKGGGGLRSDRVWRLGYASRRGPNERYVEIVFRMRVERSLIVIPPDPTVDYR